MRTSRPPSRRSVPCGSVSSLRSCAGSVVPAFGAAPTNAAIEAKRKQAERAPDASSTTWRRTRDARLRNSRRSRTRSCEDARSRSRPPRPNSSRRPRTSSARRRSSTTGRRRSTATAGRRGLGVRRCDRLPRPHHPDRPDAPHRRQRRRDGRVGEGRQGARRGRKACARDHARPSRWRCEQQARAKRDAGRNEALDGSRSATSQSLKADLKKLIEKERKRQEAIAAKTPRPRPRRGPARSRSEQGAAPPFTGQLGAAASRGRVDRQAVPRRAVRVGRYDAVRVSTARAWCSTATRRSASLCPRTSREQFHAGAYIPPDRLDLLKPGDLVFFGYDGDPNQIHHVGMYVGGGNMIHAP